jgi:hypothetical protein
MTRLILIHEPQSGLQARFELLDAAAPHSAQMLWALSGIGSSHNAIHAMWTGPEISCPIAVAGLPMSLDVGAVPAENATSFPAAGELVLVPLPARRWKGTGAADILDLGFFYDGGGRLLMPMGWITGNVCARVVPEDLSGLQAACRKIRAHGACQLSLSHYTP